MKRRITMIMAAILFFGVAAYAASVLLESQITTDGNTQWRPAVWDNFVVWQDQRNGNADIYGYNVATGVEFPICTNAFNQEHPKIYQNTVVWYDWRNGNADVYGYNLATAAEFTICCVPRPGSTTMLPRVKTDALTTFPLSKFQAA